MSDPDDMPRCGHCGRVNYDARCIWCGSDEEYTGDQYARWRLAAGESLVYDWQADEEDDE